MTRITCRERTPAGFRRGLAKLQRAPYFIRLTDRVGDDAKPKINRRHPLQSRVPHAFNVRFYLLVTHLAADRFQCIYDVRLVRPFALQAGPSHGSNRGELGDRLHRVLHGGAMAVRTYCEALHDIRRRLALALWSVRS